MARIKKFADDIPQGLSSIQTFLIDNNPNSEYFRITEFKDTFTGGKNGFLIEGSEYLKETTEVKIEILDVEGNTVYYEPGEGIPEYYEGLSKVVSVHVYEDTPIGAAKITVLGELKQYIDSGGVLRDVPEEWKGLYNVKWEKSFKINKNLTNEDKVRFYRRPDVAITEIARPIFTANPESITQTGNVSGIPIVPSPGTNLTTFPRPSQYLLTTLDNTRWTGSVINSNITIDGTTTLQPLEVVNDTQLIVSTPYTENNIVVGFDDKPYSTTFNYIRNDDGLGTALSGSFGKFVITNLETFVGDVYRVKVFRTSQADLTDFQFVQEIVLESTEILIDYEQSQRDEESYGLFTPFVLDNYWITSSNDITTEFNQSFLFNSVKLDSVGTNTFHTIGNVPISNNVQYTLSFNTRIPSVVSGNSIEVYLQGTKNGTTVTQAIGTVESSSTLLQKTLQSFNFIARDFDDCKLYFRVTGQDWYISTVSLRAAQESSFSPDEITFIQTVPRTLEQETFDFRFEFYDINNNYIPILVTATKTFSEGNLNEINKNIEIVATSLYFQFDSGSQQGNALPPKAIFFDINKEFLTGSTNFTSGAYDNDNNLLSASEYSATFYPGLLEEISEDRYRLTVESFSGSIYDNVVQYITYTAECEGVTDNITISRLADGKGGVNFDIRPFRGTVIRNSNPTSSVEIQAVRIDGINETNLRAGLPLDYSIPLLYVVSASLEGDVSYITLGEASSSGFITGLTPGTTGSGEINYNAEFNRDAINGQLTVYLIPSTTPVSESILTSLTLTDLQDGLNTGEIIYDSETFGVNPYVSFQNPSFAKTFTPTKSRVTGSFFRRGETVSPVSGVLDIYPSMSINEDYIPSFWMYYVTGGFNEDVSVVVRNENGIEVQPTGSGTFSGSFSDQNRQLSVIFTYNESYTTASVSVEKTFAIVPEGKPGDDAITVELDPRSVILQANESRVVGDYSPTITEIRVRQGNGNDTLNYLLYREERQPGTFYIPFDSVQSSNIDFGGFTSANDGEQIIITGEADNFSVEEDEKIAKLIYPIEIRPYFTSSFYTASISQSIFRQDASKAARGLTLTADTNTVTYNGDGNIVSPSGDITLTATAFNTTGSGNINFYFFKDDNFIDVVNQNSTQVSFAVPSSEFPAGGTIQTYRVELHDGNENISATPEAIASTTINGVQDGVNNYQAVVTNQNGFALYKVGGDLVFDNTSTTIEAYKGNEKLTHVSSYSFPDFDDLGNVIPNGEYQVTVHSFSTHLDLAGALVSESLLSTNLNDEAFIDVLDDWLYPIDETTLEPLSGSGTIVFRVDFEDGRESVLVQQNLSVQYEGNIGPGIIMRGIYDPLLDYQFDVPRKRRDAVIFPDPVGVGGNGETYYWATLQPSGPGFGGAQAPPTIVGDPSEDPRDANDYWEYLGKQEFFVAAKIAIFDESFVKNTINVGNNPGNEFANIVIAGGRTDPYIAVGQTGTLGVGSSGDQTTVGVIGYNRPGIFMGMSEDATVPRFSLRDDTLNNYLRWTGANLEISGDLSLSSTGAANGSFATSGIFLSSEGWISAENFYIDSSGNARFQGFLSSSQGTIGGWTINPTSLTGGSGASTIGLIPGTGIHAGADTFGASPFNVSNTGIVSASNAYLSGVLENSAVRIGSLNIDLLQNNGKVRWLNSSGTAVAEIEGQSFPTDGALYISSADWIQIGDTNVNRTNIRGQSATITGQGSGGLGQFFASGVTGTVQITGNTIILSDTGANFSSFAVGPTGLGLSPGGSNIFAVAGTIAATGNIIAYASSDKRLKNNILKIKNPLDKILKLNGYEFDWNEEKQEDFKGHDIGVIAQEVKKVLPEVVGKMKNKYLGVKYEKIVPLLIEGIKELSQKIDELEKKLNDK
jgi:hypothetical protein